MHDTAFEIGRKFFTLYVSGLQPSILDVGSQDVNGSLRKCAPAGSRYVGVDLAAGPGVDIVLDDPNALPFKTGRFDAVITTSCFEHAQMFWLIFLEMARVTRRGGYIYINAPSNGVYHSYPYDNWRFYPDAGLALVAWAAHQQIKLTLVESFIAPRKADIWNDCVIVLRKGPAQADSLPRKRLADLVRGAVNIRRHDTPGTLKTTAPTQDMRLLQQANDRLASLQSEITRLKRALSRSGKDIKALKAQLGKRKPATRKPH